MTIAQWHNQFEELAQPFHKLTRNGHYYYSVIRAIQAHKPPVPAESSQLFMLNVYLFALRKLVDNNSASSSLQTWMQSSFVGLHTDAAINQALGDMTDLLASAPEFDALSPANRPIVEQTLQLLRNGMYAESSRQEGYYWFPYSLFWNRWLIPQSGYSSLISEEIKQLQRTDHPHDNRTTLYWSRLAQGWLYFYMDNDEAAWSCLAAAGDRSGLNASHILPILDMICEEQQWIRLTAWLSAITPLLNGIHYKNYEPLWALWRTAAEHHPDAEQALWSALQSLLPGATTLYITQLYEWGKWREWMDLQLSIIENDPFAYRVDTFKPIERDEPALLLPYYHQAAERYIVMKNRDSYKKAVKLLKRLAKLYKKMKKTDEWEFFMDALVQRYSRFRAFMEELRKGKLLQ